MFRCSELGDSNTMQLLAPPSQSRVVPYRGPEQDPNPKTDLAKAGMIVERSLEHRTQQEGGDRDTTTHTHESWGPGLLLSWSQLTPHPCPSGD